MRGTGYCSLTDLVAIQDLGDHALGLEANVGELGVKDPDVCGGIAPSLPKMMNSLTLKSLLMMRGEGGAEDLLVASLPSPSLQSLGVELSLLAQD